MITGYILFSIITGVGVNSSPTSSQTNMVFETKAACENMQRVLIPNPTSSNDTKRDYVYTETFSGWKVKFTHTTYCAPIGGG